MTEGTFKLLEEYLCIVLTVGSEVFLAKVYSITHPDESRADETFSVEEVSEENRQSIKPGAIFHWKMGYLDSPAGQRRRQSIIKFVKE
jgi:hypothetical protein